MHLLCLENLLAGKHTCNFTKLSNTYVCNILAHNDTLLSLIATHAVVVVSVVGTVHVSQELLVVRDDNQLEVRLLSSDANNLRQGLCQRADVVTIKVGRGFIQSNETTIYAETFCQSQADDDRRKHLLTCRATTTHVHLRVLLAHDDTVVVALVALLVVIVGANENRVHVRAAISLLPKLFDVHHRNGPGLRQQPLSSRP